MPPKILKGEYIETETGNKVSRKSAVLGTQNIILAGKTVIQADCCIRGDLRRSAPPSSHSSSLAPDAAKASPSAHIAVMIGRYCFLSRGATIRPPGKSHRGAYSYYPVKMGDHVFVGENAVVEAALVGSYVSIGRGAVVGKFCVIKDCVRILDGAVLPQGMVVPNWSVVAGRPARIVGEVPESSMEDFDLKELCRRI
ncbi:MAG: hypothetical protein M1829_005103 [Trizodia sp. TS-e1964]|nr:MAG: hypothetical protein M1829_005103 [Trizodia sp. TS-e1964]